MLLSGGTTQSPSVIYRSGREYDRLITLACGMAPGEIVPTESLADGFSINIWTLAHGLPLLPSRGFPVANVALDYPPHAWFIHRLIDRGLTIDGLFVAATSIMSSYQQLLMLTDYFWSQNIDMRKSTIKTIESNSFYTPVLMGSRLRDYWCANVVTKFGLTEFDHANVEICAHCGFHHLGATVFPEFYAPDRRYPVDSGEGVLILTSLYPFVEMQPRIRYWTGDLFRLHPDGCVTGEIGLEFRGRASQCVIVKSGGQFRSVLTPIDVVECLSDMDGIGRDTGWYRGFLRGARPALHSPFRPGWILFNITESSLANSERTVLITVEAEFDPDELPSLARSVKSGFLDRLNVRCPRLNSDLQEEKIELCVNLVGPGGMAARNLPLTRA